MARRIHSVSAPIRISWLNLEALYDDADWRQKAFALQERRWRLIMRKKGEPSHAKP